MTNFTLLSKPSILPHFCRLCGSGKHGRYGRHGRITNTANIANNANNDINHTQGQRWQN